MELIRTIGTGSFGRVFVARLKDNPEQLVAVKRLVKAVIVKQKQVEHINTEKRILSQVEHPFIVNLLAAHKDKRYLYIVLEFVQGGEFFGYLRKQKRLHIDHARFYAATVALVFEYLHRSDIIYRDLKPENLLLDCDGFMKVTDFGFAKVVPLRTYTLCGTPEYIAPEVLLNKGHGRAVDWWTLGILIYEMIVGYPPFFDEDVMLIYQKVLAGKILFPRGFDKDAKSLVKHLLAHDLSRRYGNLIGGAADIKDHRWFAEFDFHALEQRRLQPPYVPPSEGVQDASLFSTYREARDVPLPLVGADDPFNDW